MLGHNSTARIESATLDVARLGLDPLPLSGGDLENLRECYENVRAPDPYAPIWRANTAKPRACYQMRERDEREAANRRDAMQRTWRDDPHVN